MDVIERRITTSDGVELLARVKGQGKNCLYLHGGPGSGSHWMEKFSDGMLERHFTMVYLDQRGVARSSSPDSGDYSLDRMALDFEEVRAALGFGPWLTMGHSFGGLLQMGYVLRYPASITGLICLNCTVSLEESSRSSWLPKGCEILGLDDCSEFLDPGVPVGQRVSRLGGMMRERGLFWKMAYADPASEEIMAKTFDEIPDWNWDQGSRILDLPEYLSDFAPFTAQVTAPVLWYYGLTDWMIGPDHYRQVQFPNLLLWPSPVGHVAIMENKPDLERALLAYITRFKV